ncbi:MAG TPA: hypothetical protein VFU02_14140 [Polyangiaceae bacterium]|nr:hypothetical protein [Polyangiaceae bacterium]
MLNLAFRVKAPRSGGTMTPDLSRALMKALSTEPAANDRREVAHRRDLGWR